MEESISEAQAEKLGYDRKIFNSFEERKFILNCVTYQDFIRDSIDFVIVEENNKFNLVRKSIQFKSNPPMINEAEKRSQ